MIIGTLRAERGRRKEASERLGPRQRLARRGELDGCTLECWLHGSRFDLLTGDLGAPATVPVAVHHVTIEGDDVYVALKEN